MRLQPEHVAAVNAYAARRPLPKGDGSEGFLDTAYRKPPNGWTHGLAEYFCFLFGPSWGHKRRFGSDTDPNDGAPLSAGTIAMRSGAGMECFDLLIGVGTGNPALNTGVDSDFVTDQVFYPVAPVDHVGGIVPSKRPRIVKPYRGVTAFDAAPRLVVAKDRQWVDRTMKRGLVGRMVTYARNLDDANTGRISRDFPTGLAQTKAFLNVMKAEGMRGSFVMLCGTGNDGTSRAEALDMIRRCCEVFDVFDIATIAMIQGGNENSHGIEAPYMVDREFWLEVEEIVPLKFPFAWGAGHGGEGVSTAGGSVFVHHSNRDLTAAVAGGIMGEAQEDTGVDVVDDEPKRIEDSGEGGQFTSSPTFASELLKAIHDNDLGGGTVHPAAGRSCNINLAGPIQLAAVDAYVADLGDVPVPVPVPGHRVLDAYLPGKTTDSMSDAGYNLIVSDRKTCEAFAADWYERVKGHPAADSDIAMMVYIRGVAERDRWKTFRKAWTNIMPGGDPDRA